MTFATLLAFIAIWAILLIPISIFALHNELDFEELFPKLLDKIVHILKQPALVIKKLAFYVVNNATKKKRVASELNSELDEMIKKHTAKTE